MLTPRVDGFPARPIQSILSTVLLYSCVGGMLLFAGCRSSGWARRQISAPAARYGHAADPSGQPVGGGEGYTLRPERVDAEVATSDAFLQMLADLAAKPAGERQGAVIHIFPRGRRWISALDYEPCRTFGT